MVLLISPENLCPGCMNEKTTEGKCPICGYNPDEPANPMFLAPGSMLDGRYVVGKVLESNGEGVTYIGYDTVTSSTVNIREYFPVGLCQRYDDGSVIMLSGKEYNYNDMLRRFTDLSKALFKQNGLPALFDVLDVRESNNTAYRITSALPGITLREFLMRNGGQLRWEQARLLFVPLISSLAALNNAGIIHRGISPDTLIVGKDGRLRLSGFCIPEARTAKSPLTSQLFPGYAAVEQYGVDINTQGSWTDVYAFAATIYRTLVGNPPPEATERLDNDSMTIPAKVARETPPEVLETLANALQVMPNDRTRSMDDMRRGLAVAAAAPMTSGVRASDNQSGAYNSVSSKAETSETKNKKSGKGGVYFAIACGVTLVLLAIIVLALLWILGVFGGGDDPNEDISGGGLNTSYNVQSETQKIESDANGTKPIFLPNIEGMSFAEARINADTEGFKLKIVNQVYDETAEKGDIISQSPKAETQVERNAVVEVVVSLGSYSTPVTNVIGDDQSSAIFRLMMDGFQYKNIIVETRYDDTQKQYAGRVIETVPPVGSAVNNNERITIVINSYMGEAVDPEDEPTGNHGTSSKTNTDN